MSDKKYEWINNGIGWVVFAVAAITYLLTLEPTASFWDCGEYIAQSYLLEVGHPPGNPFFALTARFFANFAPSPDKVAVCINAMSALLSAATILFLFWSITMLADKLLTKKGAARTPLNTLLTMAAGVCGALAYTWSDTFWFSAVEAEVYAFSSFCTALSYWLILKWERRSEQPGSDRYLIAIAYIIGLSVAVHLLNLLCIPAIVLVVYNKRTQRTRWWKTLIALAISLVGIVLVLYGQVPGILRIAQGFELLCVNGLNMPFNSGTAIYVALMLAAYVWTLTELYRNRNPWRIKISFMLAVILSGILFVSDNLLLPALLTVAVGCWLFFFCRHRLPVRLLTNVALYLLVIFLGFSSYAIVLIRANAAPPMNVNIPDNVFALASYMNREQYGESPLLYGTVYTCSGQYMLRDKNGAPIYTVKKRRFEKQVKKSAGEPDRYVEIAPKKEYKYAPEMYMFLPRIYNPGSAGDYRSWVAGTNERDVMATVTRNGKTEKIKAKMPSQWDNFKFFAIYQFNHMYWRYFMWNFAGRQNDISGNGEADQGNWLSCIPWVDNLRLGDQDLMPEEFGKGNAGNNKYYMLPLLLGLLGIIWTARQGKAGKRESWVLFMLFFMTGIAIVLYLNQTPAQARERDYSFAGSFYAFCVWMGLGVIGFHRLAVRVLRRFRRLNATRMNRYAAGAAAFVALAIPLQMVSQTWDDHDRTGRYFCTDYAKNILASIGHDAILLTSGDNNSFPLWYAQDTEGYRTDVRVLNTDYMASQWYIAQVPMPYFESSAVDLMAHPDSYAYKRRLQTPLSTDSLPVDAATAFARFYSDTLGNRKFNAPVIAIGYDKQRALANIGLDPSLAANAVDSLYFNALINPQTGIKQSHARSNRMMIADIVASNVLNGWKRPVGFVKGTAATVFHPIAPYMAQTGMVIEVTPFNQESYTSVGTGYTDRAYDNFMHRFQWGGLDKATPDHRPYLDEVNRDMVTWTRMAMLDLAERLIEEGEVIDTAVENPDTFPLLPASLRNASYAVDRYTKARDILVQKETKLPEFVSPSNYEFHWRTAEMLYTIADRTGNEADRRRADSIMEQAIDRFARHMLYFQSLTFWQPISSGDQLLFSNGGFLHLLSTYMKGNEAAARRKIDRLTAERVDIWSSFRRTIRCARDKQLPYSEGNRLLDNIYEAYYALHAYDSARMDKLMAEDEKFSVSLLTAIEYHTQCRMQHDEKLKAEP